MEKDTPKNPHADGRRGKERLSRARLAEHRTKRGLEAVPLNIPDEVQEAHHAALDAAHEQHTQAVKKADADLAKAEADIYADKAAAYVDHAAALTAAAIRFACAAAAADAVFVAVVKNRMV